VCPGGVWPAGLVGTGDAVSLATAVSEAVGRDVAWPDEGGAEPADGEGDGAGPGRELAGDRAAEPWSGLLVPSLCVAAAGARGAAQSVNGAAGPPAIATTMATRQMASAATDTTPIRRMARRRRPDGSVNTGLECTAGV
jgi:hypothetical protein